MRRRRISAELVLQQDEVKIYELVGSGDQGRIEALLGLYADLFPQYKHYVPRMRQRAKSPAQNQRGHTVHYWLAEVDGAPAGFRTFRYVPTRRCGLAVTLAVAPEFREVIIADQRLPIYLVYRCLDQIIADAKAAGAPPVLGIVNEVDYPELMQHYIRHGLVELPVKYKEPIFSESGNIEEVIFSPMHLGFLTNPELGEFVLTQEYLTDFVLAFLVDHYGVPEDHPEVQLILSSIPIIH